MAQSYPLPKSPFHSLHALEAEERGLLIGREADVARLGELLARPTTRGIWIEGGPGVGKSSLLRAGLLPTLPESGFTVLVGVIRPGPDLAGQLASAIAAFAEDAEGLTDKLDDFQAGRSLEEILRTEPTRLTQLWNLLPDRVVLALEQAEDLVLFPESERQAQLLDALMHSAHGKVVACVRSEFLGQVQALLSMRGSWETYHLTELDDDALIEILAVPGGDEPLPFHEGIPNRLYPMAFETDAGRLLVEEVNQRAGEKQVSRLSLLLASAEVLQSQRHNLVRLRQIQKFDFDAVIDALIRTRGLALGVPKSDLNALTRFLGDLTQPVAGGFSARALVPLEVAQRRWTGVTPFETMLDSASGADGLLQVETAETGDKIQALVTPSQELLAAYRLESESRKKRNKFGWGKVVDSLFVFLPLLFLLWAIQYYFQQRQRTEFVDAVGEGLAKMKRARDLLTLEKQELTAALEPLQLVAAQQASGLGDTLKARQALLSVSPEHRSFAWHYLWKTLNPEKEILQDGDDAVTAVAVSPTGKLVASADETGVVRIWTVERDHSVLGAVYTGHKKPVTALAFTPDEAFAISAGADGTVRFWPTKTDGHAPIRLQAASKTLEPAQPVRCLAVSADGKWVIAGTSDRTASLWDVASGQKRETLQTKADIAAVAIDPTGKTFALAFGASVGQGALPEFKFQKEMKHPDGSKGVSGLAYLDAQRLLVNDSQQVSIWNVNKTKVIGDGFPSVADIIAMTYLPEQKRLLTAGSDRVVRLWDVDSATEVAQFPGPFSAVRNLSVSAQSGLLVVAGTDARVRLYDIQAVSRPASIDVDALSVAFAPKDRLIATGGKDGKVRFWDEDGASLGEIKTGGPVAALEFAVREGSLTLAAASHASQKHGSVTLWKIALKDQKIDASPAEELSGIQKNVVSLSFSPKADRLVVATAAGMQVFSLQDKAKEIFTSKSSSTCVHFADNDNEVFAETNGGDLWIWDLKANKYRKSPDPVHTSGMVGFSLTKTTAGDELAFSVGRDHRVLRTRRPKGKEDTKQIARLGASPTCIAGGQHVGAVGDAQGGLHLFDLDRNGESLVIAAHRGPIVAVAVSPDERTIATVGADGKLVLHRGDIGAAPHHPEE